MTVPARPSRAPARTGPAPRGEIRVRHRHRAGGAVVSDIEAPPGVDIERA
jgi:hypothetical protein